MGMGWFGSGARACDSCVTGARVFGNNFYNFASASVASSASKPYYNLYGGETGEFYLRAQMCYVRY